MNKITFLVLPTITDVAGQMRLVSRVHESHITGLSLADYRRVPNLWADAGLVKTNGALVCIQTPKGVDRAAVVREFRDCEPIWAGTTLTFDLAEEPAMEMGA